MNSYKLLLVGHGGCHNRGCEAIIRTTSALLTSALGEVSFVVQSFNHAFDLRVQPPIDGIKFMPVYPRRFEPVLLPRRIIRRTFKMLGLSFVDRWQDHEMVYLRHLLGGCDAVLSVGGDNYTEDYGYSAQAHAEVLRLARLSGKKTVIWAASIGPFQDVVLRERMRQFLQQVDLITVRESKTLKYLRSLGVSENVRLVADPAFTLEPTASERVDDMIASRSRPLLGINVSGFTASARTPEARAHVSNSFISFIERFVAEVGGDVFLIPHDINEHHQDPYKGNDHFVMQGICEKMRLQDQVGIAPKDMNAQETKYLISKCDYFIGAKTHSTIASLSSLVPTISIAYSTKAYGINFDLFGHTDYVLPRDDISAKTLWQAWKLLVKDRSLIRETLANKIPEVRQCAMAGALYLSELFCRDRPLQIQASISNCAHESVENALCNGVSIVKYEGGKHEKR